MSLNNFGLGIVFTASDLASNVIRGLSRSFMGLDKTANKALDSIAKKIGISNDKLTTGLKGMAKGLAVAGAGFLGLRAAFGVTDLAGQFEFKLAGIKAISGATAVELKQLEQAALQAGIATQFSPLEAAEGLQILAQAGFKTRQSIETLVPVLDLAAASLEQLGLEEAGGVTIAAMKVFPEAANDATLAVDNLVRSTSRSSLQFRELPLALGIAARGAKIFNASMEDTLIALGEVRNVIPTVERGATSVATAMELLAMPKTQKQLKELGVQVKTLDRKNFRPFLDVMADTSKAFKAMSGDAERGERLLKIFGRRGVSGLAPLLDAISARALKAGDGVADYSKALAEMRGEMRTTEITAAKFRDELNATFKGMKTLLQGTLDTIVISVGLPFAKALAPVVDSVTKTLNSMLRAFMNLGEGTKVMIARFLILASAIALVFGTVTALVAMKGVLIAIGVAAGAVLLPFIKVLAVIALVAGAVILLKKAWDANVGGMRTALMPVLEKVTMFFKGLFQVISSGKITGALAKQLGDPANSGILDFITGFAKAFAFIKAAAIGIFGALKSTFDRLVVAVTPLFFQLRKSFFLIGSLVLKVGKIIGKAFGLDMTKNGIDSVTTFANVFTKVFLEPIVFGLETVAFGLEVMFSLINGLMTVAEKLASPFVALASIVGGAFNIVFGLLTGNMKAVSAAVKQTVNGAIALMNTLIEGARQATILITPDIAGSEAAINARFESLKLRKFDVEDDVGAKVQAAPTVAQLTSQAQTQSGTTSTSGTVSTTAGALPQSVPSSTVNQQGGGGLSAADIKNVLEAAMRAGMITERGRPIVLQSSVNIDGEVLGSVQAQRVRDARASRGNLAPSLKDE